MSPNWREFVGHEISQRESDMPRRTRDYNVDTVVIEFRVRDDRGTNRTQREIFRAFKRAVDELPIENMINACLAQGHPCAWDPAGSDITVLSAECKLG